jgi:hypothetical protein
VAATATHDPALGEQPAPEDAAERLFEPGGTTLEDLVLGAWDELVVKGRAECPVCGDSMSAADGCWSCGAELS